MAESLKAPEEQEPDSLENRVDLVEILMRKFEALEKEVMRQNHHLASSFTQSMARQKSPNNRAPIAKNFEEAKQLH